MFLYEEEAIKSLSNVINLENTCGYITCVTTPTKYENKFRSEQSAKNGLPNLSHYFINLLLLFNICNGISFIDPSPVFQKNGVSLLKEELEKLNDVSSVKKTLLLEPVCDTPEWTLLDCCFGLPLFNSEVNQSICKYIVENQMWKEEK